jgi:hypothetical protein
MPRPIRLARGAADLQKWVRQVKISEVHDQQVRPCLKQPTRVCVRKVGRGNEAMVRSTDCTICTSGP